MALKIPKKFADICTLVRDGNPDGLTKFTAYDGLENQKKAVLAVVGVYFEGNFTEALELDKEICPFWDEWHYSNVREHVSAMAFAARHLSREDEMIDFFQQQAEIAMKDSTKPTHIQQSYNSCYKNYIEFIKTGIVPHFTEKRDIQTAFIISLHRRDGKRSACSK